MPHQSAANHVSDHSYCASSHLWVYPEQRKIMPDPQTKKPTTGDYPSDFCVVFATYNHIAVACMLFVLLCGCRGKRMFTDTFFSAFSSDLIPLLTCLEDAFIMTEFQNEIINQIAFLKSHKCAAGFVCVRLAVGHRSLVPRQPLPWLCCGSLPPHSLCSASAQHGAGLLLASPHSLGS